MATFRHPVLFIVLFLVSGLSISQEDKLEKLKEDFQLANHDTSRVKLLFRMGDLYIDGPSDSLLHYYGKALVIIRKNLSEIDQHANPDLYSVFEFYEIRALIEFGIEYFYRSDYDKALDYYFKALEAAEIKNDIELISECNSEIGIVYKNQGKFELALKYYDKALEYALLTKDTSWIASCRVNIGNVYKEKGFLSQALKYYLDALKILEELGHDRRIAACFQNIGDIYRNQRDYNKALDYYSKALQLAIRTSDLVRQTTCYLNIGYVYANFGNYTIARDYYEKAGELYKRSGYSHEMDDLYILMGDSYMGEDDSKKALEYYELAMEISINENDLARQAEIFGKLGEVYKKNKSYNQALEYIQTSLQLSARSGMLEILLQASLNLSEIYEIMGMTNQSLYYYKLYSNYKDSLFSADKYRAITEMEIKYESEKKEQQMILLEEKNQVQLLKLSKRNRMLYGSLIVFLLSLVLIYILFRNHRLRTKHKAIELEQKLMRSQMNPHFIFNSLIAIQSYIYKKEAIRAGDYLAKFAELIRITLENSRVDFVSLEKELKMLNVYLELQLLRFENIFNYKVTVESDTEASNLYIPPMMAQPFVENAIEHGLMHKEEKGFISIHFEKSRNYITCTVEDDGIGRKKAGEMKKRADHQSMATSITRERLKIFSRRSRQSYTMRLEDLFDQNNYSAGTRVVFTIPYKISEQ